MGGQLQEKLKDKLIAKKRTNFPKPYYADINMTLSLFLTPPLGFSNKQLSLLLYEKTLPSFATISLTSLKNNHFHFLFLRNFRLLSPLFVLWQPSIYILLIQGGSNAAKSLRANLKYAPYSRFRTLERNGLCKSEFWKEGGENKQRVWGRNGNTLPSNFQE